MPSSYDPLSEAAIRAALIDVPLVRQVVYLPVVGSTNNAARDLAGQGAPHMTLVVTDEQPAGRGRLGRSWYMPPLAAIAMSIVVRPELAAARAQRLTMLAGLAVAEGVEQAAGLAVVLKWPNDVVAPGQLRKLGGILTETAMVGERIDYAAVGIGLNVNADFAGRPDLSGTATSLRLLLGREIDRLSVLAAIVERFMARFDELSAGDALRAAWAARLATLHRRVEARVGDAVWIGVAEAVDDDGALWLRSDDGARHRLLAADVNPLE